MLLRRSSLLLACHFWLPAALQAELPLPDATIHGQITAPTGAPVSTGAPLARVGRGGAPVLEVAGSFVSADGAAWYVVKVPLETNLGAPGPGGLFLIAQGSQRFAAGRIPERDVTPAGGIPARLPAAWWLRRRDPGQAAPAHPRLAGRSRAARRDHGHPVDHPGLFALS
jgi:hypothetical protein